MAKASTAVAPKTANSEISTEIPDYLKDHGPVAREDNFDSNDVTLPQIKLLQGTSEQITVFDNATPGEFWHTGMDKPLGKSLRFVVCSRRKKYLLQAPLDDGQGVLARADDALTWDRKGKWNIKVDKKTTVEWEIADLDVAKSGLTEWGTFDPSDENSPPAATLFYEYLVLLPDFLELGPAVLSLARSAIKKAKKGLNDKITLHTNSGRPMQAIVFEARVVTEQNDSNQDFFNWMFTGAGFAPQEMYNSAKAFSEMLKTYKVQDEGSQDGAAPREVNDEL